MNRNAFIPFGIAILTLVVSAVGYFFWYSNVSGFSSRIAELSANILEKTEESKRIVEAKNALSSLAKEEKLVEQYFISTANVVAFLEEMQTVGKSLGTRVEITSVSSDETSSFPHLTVSFSISGTWSSVMRTLGALEFSPHDIITNDVVLGVSGKNHWIATGTFTVGTRKPEKTRTTQQTASSTTP